MWFQSWQAGYHDILRRGFPKPTDPRTILAELRTPTVEDFLHEGSGDVPFLVSPRARETFEKHGLTGFEFGPVVVAKIASKGRRKREQKCGEPEDLIMKSRGIPLDAAPTLHAIWITGSVDVVPDFDSGRTPSGAISPFRPVVTFRSPDLWRPKFGGEPFSAWSFCSDRFRRACEEHQLSNIRFEPLEDFMRRFREPLEKKANKAPEPTTMAVTPRATSRITK